MSILNANLSSVNSCISRRVLTAFFPGNVTVFLAM